MNFTFLIHETFFYCGIAFCFYEGKFVYPDENYAREIMQLFTIGLFKLNKDGTNVQDQNGDPIPTYNTDDIMEMARAWTGFVPQGGRGNIELARASNNRIDYLSINGRYRDPFPKMDLNGGKLYTGSNVWKAACEKD